jgi:hypothetical protein
MVSCEEWTHSSHFQFGVFFFIVITFVIVFTGGGPGVIVMAMGILFVLFAVVVSAVHNFTG